MNWVAGEIVEFKSLANGERTIRAVFQHCLDERRALVRDHKMRFSQVISTDRLRRPRSVAILCGPGRLA